VQYGLGSARVLRTGKAIVIATTDGRAYFEFVNLLKRLSLPHRDLLPGEAFIYRDSLILTTRKELPLISPRAYFLFEEMNGDFEHDAVFLLSRLFQSRNDNLLLGVDPGGMTGIAVLYRGYPVSFHTFSSYFEAIAFIDKMLRLHVNKLILRIGKGDFRGERIASQASKIAETLQKKDSRCQIIIEMVDESGTSKREESTKLKSNAFYPYVKGFRAAIQKDALAALGIARRRGKPFANAV